MTTEILSCRNCESRITCDFLTKLIQEAFEEDRLHFVKRIIRKSTWAPENCPLRIARGFENWCEDDD